MILEYFIGCLLIGMFLGVAIREALLIFNHGWAYGEKLRIYDRERGYK